MRLLEDTLNSHIDDLRAMTDSTLKKYLRSWWHMQYSSNFCVGKFSAMALAYHVHITDRTWRENCLLEMNEDCYHSDVSNRPSAMWLAVEAVLYEYSIYYIS